MATIKAIEGQAVHQIQSGQVIVDLCSVVKELVENSLDAGATSIDVRFKNQGLDAIEVQDNGSGISPHNYETIALKHHTSKLSKYSDLLALKSFGFRGEALSSLCALAQVSIVTCLPEDAPKGAKLEFETSGKLKETSVVAAQKGTTVSIRSIFGNLPVRRRALSRNIKREWSKVTNVLSQYACIQVGVKFSVSQQGEKDKRTTVFSTKGNHSFKDNIVNVFGAKMLTNLVSLDLNLGYETRDSCSKGQNINEIEITKNIRITGHISRPNTGEGRQVPERQMFFVNSRPCNLPQIAKIFNEVFRSISGSSAPFIFANIELDTHMYDVNVSPDKRTILLHNQDRILESLRSSLTKSLESQQSLIPMSQFSVQKQSNFKQTQINIDNSTNSSNQKRLNTSMACVTHDHVCKDSSTKDTESDLNDLDPNSINLIVESRSPSLGPSVIESENMNILLSPLKINLNFVSKLGDQELCNITKDSIIADDAFHESTKQDVVTSNSRTLNDFMQISPTPKFKRQNETLLSHKESLEQPHPKKSCKSREFDTRFEEFFLPILPDIDVSPPPTSGYSISSFGDNKLVKSIKYINTGISPLEGRKMNTKKSPKKVPKDFSRFRCNFSQMFSAPDLEAFSSTFLHQDNKICDTNSENENSQNLSQTPLEVSEDTTNTDDETSEALSTPGVNNFNIQEDIETYITPDIAMDITMNDEAKKKACEEAKIQKMIQEVEITAKNLAEGKLNRSQSLLKGFRKKDSTFNLVQTVQTNIVEIRQQFESLQKKLSYFKKLSVLNINEEIDQMAAEEKLSLKISKSDFSKMKIIGQFNLGFILVSRSSRVSYNSHDESHDGDDLFIIDQHASDEKYNFERLQATTIVQSQKLAVPKPLDLTALEEEIVIENLSILQSNGFGVRVDQSGNGRIGNRCELISLPLSHETTFSLSDLEELLSLLAENSPSGTNSVIPRPSKVRKMFAMRACRSSIMIGKTLTQKQMKKVVVNLGELDKPWNCPHGRPTMRHLCGLDIWDNNIWKQDVVGAAGTNWVKYRERAQTS
ncbi:putative dna mismatch repair protein [Erysiphe neolycopersici]|uniref:DNA mismatch repair protein PMS1 n=1 Tax=Erysiphe neolycopersici TaxID=212602 RepID=A0A420I4D1_9PEZI|nr:putative dna mismatch repair protein [Erysiphe neolycopersici]